MGRIRKNGVKIKETARKPTPTRQHQPPQSGARALHDLASTKMKTVTRRLVDLQDEKAKLEEMIHKLTTRKQKQQELLQRQRQQHQQQTTTAAAATKSDDDASDDESAMAHRHKPHHQRHRNYKHSDSNNNSVVSSLPSRAQSYQYDDDEDVDDEESSVGYDGDENDNNVGSDDDDISVMTENMYHYDARGRRFKDEDLLETGTTAACFQNVTGTNNHLHDTAIPSSSNHKKPSKSNKHKSSLQQQQQQQQEQPRVTIEWKSGKTYVPEANLAYDYGGDVYQYHHPTDLSLLVVDDKSYWDDLSISSGEDIHLAAAETDLPMVLDLSGKQNGDSDESVQSGLHSECSVSVAVAPFANATSANSTTPSLTASSKSSSSRRHRRTNTGGGGGGGLALQTPNRTNNPTPYLYHRSNSMDDSNSNSNLAMNDTSSSTQHQEEKEAARRGRRPGKEADDDCPPPLTSDMSLVDSKITDDADNGYPSKSHTKQNRDKDSTVPPPPPVEISFSEEVSRDDDGMESLGSELCGVSVTQQGQDHPTASAPPTTISHKASPPIPTATAATKQTSSNNTTKKEKKSKPTPLQNNITINTAKIAMKDSPKKIKKKKSKK